MAKKWNDYTWREKMIGIGAVIVGVFVLGSAASAVGNTTSSNNQEPSATKQVQTTPVTTYKELDETEPVAFEKTSAQSSSLASGTSQVTTAGVDGVRTLTYKITLVDGAETKRDLISNEVTTQPTAEVTTIGTYVAPVAPQQPTASGSGCDSNYSGGCVPVASDVDCGGGRGNGPAYFYGTASVVGSDIYGLDGDDDGIACE